MPPPELRNCLNFLWKIKKLFGFVNKIILYRFAGDFSRWDEANGGPCSTNHTAGKCGKEDKRTDE